MELGIYTFVENTPHPEIMQTVTPEQRLKNLMEEIELADQTGLEVFGIGEHHRFEYLSSAPEVLLAAGAERSKNIKLTSAVNVISSDDPVRVFQQFSTIDQLSGGRAEIMVGRGSFIESFPLFGYDLNDYPELFAEKLDLLLKLRESETITWKGKHRPSIDNRGVYPRPYQKELPVWVAVGGTPESAYRAGAMGLPMALGIIGGQPARFKPLAEIHKQGASENGLEAPPLSINSHGFIADDEKDAADTAFPAFKEVMDKIGKERGWPPMSRDQFEASRTIYGANFVGSPQQIIEKILHQHELFGHERLLLQFSVGSIPHKKMMRCIELYGTEVAPAVGKALGV